MSTSMGFLKGLPRSITSISWYIMNIFSIRDAIAREKQLKGWTRTKKNALVETENPGWEEIALEE